MKMKEDVCCVTGHRSLPREHLDSVRAQLEAAVRDAIADGYRVFLSGFAEGADLLFAEAVLRHREEHSLRLVAAIPYRRRLERGDAAFQRLLARCDRVECISEEYHRHCFRERNRWMVDRSERVIAVYDGRKRGGTFGTVRYALSRGRQLRLVTWPAGSPAE